MNPEVLLVIPCFRESGRIRPFLTALRDVLHDDAAVSVQVVDDGSGEEEPGKLEAIVESLREDWPGLLPLQALPENLGKGGAVYAGWETRAGQDWLAFVDADGSCSAAEVWRVINLARVQPSPVALFASRVCILGRRIQRDFHRHLIGRVYATIVSEMLNIPVYDSQCGLKIIPTAAFARLHDCLQVQGFSFDVELLCALLDAGIPVVEVPIDWHETGGGKVRLVQDSLRMFRDVLSIRRRRATASWRALVSTRPERV